MTPEAKKKRDRLANINWLNDNTGSVELAFQNGYDAGYAASKEEMFSAVEQRNFDEGYKVGYAVAKEECTRMPLPNPPKENK